MEPRLVAAPPNDAMQTRHVPVTSKCPRGRVASQANGGASPTTHASAANHHSTLLYFQLAGETGEVWASQRTALRWSPSSRPIRPVCVCLRVPATQRRALPKPVAAELQFLVHSCHRPSIESSPKPRPSKLHSGTGRHAMRGRDGPFTEGAGIAVLQVLPIRPASPQSPQRCSSCRPSIPFFFSQSQSGRSTFCPSAASLRHMRRHIVPHTGPMIVSHRSLHSILSLGMLRPLFRYTRSPR